MKPNLNRRIFSAMLVITILSVALKGIGTFKEVLVSSYFGTGNEIDAFLFAYIFPSFGVNIIAGAFAGAFMPTFIHVREHDGPEKAKSLFSEVAFFSIILLSGISALMALVVPVVIPYLATGFSAEKVALTRSLFFTLLPVIVMGGVATTWSTVMNAGEKFALTTIAPAMRPLGIVIFVLVAVKYFGIYSIAIGLIFGHSIELGLLAFGLKRRGFPIVPRRLAKSSELRFVLGQYFPLAIAHLVVSGASLVDSSMAAMLVPGSVAALNYGSKLVDIFLTIVIGAVGSVLLPHFSRLSALRDWKALRHTYNTYAFWLFMGSLPLTLGLIFFSEPIIKLVFQRGAFTAKDAILVSKVQMMSALQIPFYILSIITIRMITALKATQFNMILGFMTFTVNIVFNYIFMKWFGVVGIALSTAVVYATTFVFMYVMMSYLLKVRAKELT